MKEVGYYEIGMTARYFPQMRASALAGNVMQNRLHWHEHIEVICCLRGEFGMRVDGQEFWLKERDVLTVNSNCMHEIFDGKPGGLQIIFSADTSLLKKETDETYVFATVGEGALSQDNRDISEFRQCAAKLAAMLTVDQEKIEAYFKAATDEQEIKNLGNLVLGTEEEWYCFQSRVYQCLACLARHKQRESAGRRQRTPEEQFRRCIGKIHKDYAKFLDANVLAEEVKVSQPTVYRMFQKYLGVSVNDYIRMVRIQSVCAMLEQGDDNITEIAYACGFTSLSNFYRVFHQQMHQTPKEYCARVKGSGYQDQRRQREFLDVNRFQNFYELPYKTQELLLYAE